MGFLRNIADRFDPVETRTADPVFSTVQPLAGTRAIDSRLAENLSTVLACVNAISGALASLPVWVYRNEGPGRELVNDHPLSALVRNGPNRHMTWPDFVEFWLAQTLLNGNGIAEVKRDGSGAVLEIIPIPWSNVSISLLPSGRLAYDIVDNVSIYGGNGRSRRLLDGEVLHLKDRSDDGLLGRSRLQRAASVVSAALGTQEFSASMFERQATPNGALKMDNRLTVEQREELRNSLSAFQGSANARGILILENGMEFQQIALSAEDAELLQSRRFSTEEIARLYQVPPPIIGDLSHGTFTNSETSGRWFATHTLTP